MKKQLRDYMMLSFAALLVAVGVYFFKFPNNFTYGGISGISVLLGRIFALESTATLNMIMDYSLLAIGLLVLGRNFAVRTIYCCLLYSFLVFVFERIYPMNGPFTDEPLLELIITIAFSAVGAGIMFNLDASSGGTEIIAMIIRKYSKLNTTSALMASDIVVAAGSLFVFGIETCMFSVLGLVLRSLLANTVLENIRLCKYFNIVTTRHEEICSYIINDMKRSATLVKAEGAYTREDRKMVLVACRRNEAIDLQKHVKKIDPNAFMFISNTSEIIGKNFLQI
ncbi:MAG: YitT family protein [Clostridia bacterium]|nr:YitT family protein [Clostridia bacterium]